MQNKGLWVRRNAILPVLSLIFSSFSAFAGSDWDVFTADDPLFNMLGDYRYDISAGEINLLGEKYKNIPVNSNSAASLNTFGYRLYERKAYTDAATAFRRAIQLDPTYVFPHYNLACMLALSAGGGKRIDPGELIYHLQYAALLDVKYREKPGTDTDLDPVRDQAYFRDYLRLLEEGRVILDDKSIYITTNTEKVCVTGLVEGAAGPLLISPEISESLDKKAAAFISAHDKEYHVFILTSYGLLVKVTSEGLADLQSVFYCRLVWQPQNKGLLFDPGPALLYYEIASGKIKEVLRATEDMYSLKDYHFISPDKIGLMGGGYFEYSFAGAEYEIRLDGSGFRKVPGGRVEAGEDLRGGGGD
jgi:hypothetical protein